MPSPVGHAIGGLAVAWAADLVPGVRGWRTAAPTASFARRSGGALTLVCAGLGVLPDADLFLTTHRTVTHSVVAAFVVTIVAAAVTGWVTRERGAAAASPAVRRGPLVVRIALMCGAAYATHLLLDWLAVDRTPPAGIQLLWPFSPHWFISGLDIFPQTERRQFLSLPSMRTNLVSLVWESATLLPVLGLLWLIRIKALARLAAELSRSDHSA